MFIIITELCIMRTNIADTAILCHCSLNFLFLENRGFATKITKKCRERMTER